MTKHGMRRERRWLSLIGRFLGLLGVTSMLFAAGPVAAQSSSTPMKEIRLSLGFIVLGRYAPFYVARAKGYYKAAGLDVTFIPSQGGTAQAIQAIQSGSAEFAISDLAGLMVGQASGASTAKMIAVYYQKAPYAIFSTEPGANVTKPEQLVGLDIGTSAGSATPNIIKGFMRQRGLDATKVHFTNLDPNVRVGMMLSGKIPAIETFILGKPGIERGAGSRKVRTLLLADYGLKLYSSGIVATSEYLKANPEIAKAFVKASLLGWRDAFANPEEAATIMEKEAKGLTHQSIVDEVKIVRDLSVTSEVRKAGLGSIDPAHFRSGIEFLTQYGGFKGTPSPESLYSTAFLPTPPVMPAKP